MTNRCNDRAWGQRAKWLAAAGILVPSATAAAVRAPAPTPVDDGIFQIVLHADPFVKAVMIVLLAASITTWALWFVKSAELRAAKLALKRDIRVLGTARTLAEAQAVSYDASACMVKVVADELALAGDAPSHRALEGVEERVAVQLPIEEARAIHRIMAGTSVLASIGAIAPFVGLTGTVWGIMNSFLGISRTQSTSLAVVAPGIAEALLATAIGLAAAIPAVLIYNGLARAILGYRRLLSEIAVLTACVLSREVETRATDDASPARPASVSVVRG